MRILRPLLIVLLACTCGRAQKITPDSLRTIITNAPNDSVRIRLYSRLLSAQRKDSSAMLGTLDTMRRLSERMNTDFARGYHLKMRSWYEKRMKRHDRARELNLRSLAEFEKADLTKLLMDGHTEQAYLWRSANNLERIFFHAEKALGYARELDDLPEMGISLNSMGIVQRRLGDKEAATRYFRQTLAIFTELNDTKNQFSPTLNLSNLYSDLGRTDSAIYYGNLALDIANRQEPPNKNQLAYIYNNLGVLYEKQKDYATALATSRKALRYIGETTEDVTALSAATGNVGNNLLQLGRFREALPYLQRSMAQARTTNHLPSLEQRSAQLAKTHAGLGNLDSVIHYYEEHDAFVSAITDSLQLQAVAEMEARYQNKEKQAEIDRLALEDEIKSLRLKRQNRLIGGGLLVLGLLGSFLYFLLQQRRRIRAQNETISLALNEKNTLLKEIHHRVKNNLQMVSSLLSLQSDYIEDDAALDALKMGQSRVRSMAIIHQKLYMRDQVSTAVSAKDYLDQLISELMQTLNVSGVPLKMTKRIEEVNLDIDRLIPLGLVANEVITNAMKYAFVNRDSGRLDIDFRRNDNDIELIIADDGPGLGRELSTTSHSFGSLLIRTFAEQLEGTVEVDDTEGTRVALRFPFT